MKIVSLLPSATEIVFALGLQDSLAGVTFECDHPAEAREKTIVSTTTLETGEESSARDIDRLVAEKIDAGENLYRIDEAAIAGIQPDLILAQDLCRVCAVPSGQVTDALDKLGCRAQVISLDPHTVGDILDGMLQVGRACGSEDEAATVVDDLRRRVERVRSIAARLEPVRTLSLEWVDPPFAGGHWVPEMISVAGGIDVLGQAGRPSRRVSWDDVLSASPDALVFMPCGYGLEGAMAQIPSLLERDGVASLPAVSAGKAFAVDASSFFSRPGPRVVDGIEILAWALHPESFNPPPPGRIARPPDAGSA